MYPAPYRSGVPRCQDRHCSRGIFEHAQLQDAVGHVLLTAASAPIKQRHIHVEPVQPVPQLAQFRRDGTAASALSAGRLACASRSMFSVDPQIAASGPSLAFDSKTLRFVENVRVVPIDEHIAMRKPLWADLKQA